MKIVSQSYLNEAIARQIVKRSMDIIHYSVNVMDHTGMIIASGDPSRMYQRHEGAILALTENRMIEIDSSMTNKLKGVKSGINLPISFRNKLVGVVGISGKPEEVRAYAELVKMAAELILEQRAMITEIQWEKRYREELANQLIQDDYNQHEIESMVAYLGLDLTVKRIALILELAPAEFKQVRKLSEFFESHEPEWLVTVANFNELIVLKPVVLKNGHWDIQQERKQLQQLISRLSVFHVERVIAGGYFIGEHAIHHSYLSAKATQDAVIKAKSKNKYVFYSEYSLPVLLNCYAEGWQSKELMKNWQKLVNDDKKGVLQSTLKHYFVQNCDLSQTAKQLHIHVNTLRYRLQRIEQITGLNMNKLQDILWLYIGMQMSV